MGFEICGLAPLLQVFDMPSSIRFYCDVLGFEIVSTDGKPCTAFRLGAVDAEWRGTHAKHSVRGASPSADAPDRRKLTLNRGGSHTLRCLWLGNIELAGLP